MRSYDKAKYEQIQQNQWKLRDCQLHDFSIDITPAQTYGKRYMCSHCDGEVGFQEKAWYEKGLKHAKNQ